MQFAGQRTDLALNPVGQPTNTLICLSEDTLPSPDAVLITGITPQATLSEGVSEAVFLASFTESIATPGTIFVGYNTVRFDDEFMRYLHYRNFYDPYEWQWQDNRSRWDMLDVVRMTRALRPDGIQWPFDTDGKPSNRLELMAAVNGLDHRQVHDALSDVDATIALSRMIRNKHERLFDFLLAMRDKRRVAELVHATEPFLYTSGTYASEFAKTTIVSRVCERPTRQASFVYDLRYDPAQYKKTSPQQLAELWKWQRSKDVERLPIKTLQYNRVPAIAPLSVLDKESQKRLQLDLKVIEKHRATLAHMSDFKDRLCQAWELIEGPQTELIQTTAAATDQDVDALLYTGFFEAQDKQNMRVVRAAAAEELGSLDLQFEDPRLKMLLPLYKARNYPQAMTSDEHQVWDQFRAKRLLGDGVQSRMAVFFSKLQEIADRKSLTQEQSYLVEELRLYGETIMPI